VQFVGLKGQLVGLADRGGAGQHERYSTARALQGGGCKWVGGEGVDDCSTGCADSTQP